MESVAVVGSGPEAARWVRRCLAAGLDVVFLRPRGPIERVFRSLPRLEGPDLVLLVDTETSPSWLSALEARMSAGAVLATCFSPPPSLLRESRREDQIVAILDEGGAAIVRPHPGTAPGVVLATERFLARLTRERARRGATPVDLEAYETGLGGG